MRLSGKKVAVTAGLASSNLMTAVTMGRLLQILITLIAMTTAARAELEVGASVQIHAKAEFEAPLAPHGTWVEVGSYGRCWRPAHVGVEWRPYCSGEWVWTDCGWYWSSEEPWAWACYHYGWWAYCPAFGWVWVPQVEWAPAWVSWRVGGGYIGWAPLPPQGIVFARHPEPDHFVFVGTASFGAYVRPSSVIVKNSVILSHTTELGGVTRESHAVAGSASQKVMVNHGPALDTVQKATGRTFTPVPIQEAARRTASRTPNGHEVSPSHNARDKRDTASWSEQGSDHHDSSARDSFGSSSGGEG